MADNINMAWIFGLGAIGLAAWYLLSGKADADNGMSDIIKQVQAANPSITDDQAKAQAAALLAQKALDTAHDAAVNSGVPEAATASQTAEAANTQAQVTASSNPQSDSAQQAAAAAAAAAATQRAQYEQSVQAQLNTTQGALSQAKTALDAAVSAYNSACQGVKDQIANTAAFYARSEASKGAVFLWRDKDMSGGSQSYASGDYPVISQTGFPDNALSSFQVARGYKAIFYRDTNFQGGFTVQTASRETLKIAAMSSTEIPDNSMSSMHIEQYPSAFDPERLAAQANVTNVAVQVNQCLACVNDCIERVQSVLDLMRLYGVLQSQVTTVDSSLKSLRSYVATIKV